MTTPAGTTTAEKTWSTDVGHPRRWWILTVLATVAFMAQLDLFIVNVAVPTMSRSFGGAALSDLSWVLNAYTIVFAALLVPAGRLADHFGRRRFLLGGVAIFTIASAVCAIAPSLGLLITGRVIQAVGAALIVPASLGLLLPAFSSRQHTAVVGIWAGVAAVAGASGPPVGGLLVGLSWRWIFLINLPIGLFALLLGLKMLPEVRAERGARLPDAVSAVALLIAITAAILATVEGPSWGWAAPSTITLYGVAVVTAIVTVHRSINHPRALIEAALFHSREFTTASVALFLFFVAFATWLLVTVLFLQDVWHYGPVRAGLAMSPGPLVAALFALNSGRIGARFGRVLPALTGTVLIIASAGFWLIAAPADPSYLTGFLPGLIAGGAAAGLTQAPLFAAASTLPADRATTGSAVLNMSRQLGSAVGVAGLVALLASAHPNSLGQIHRGWFFEIAMGAATALAILLLRPRKAVVRAA